MLFLLQVLQGGCGGDASQPLGALHDAALWHACHMVTSGLEGSVPMFV
jgi:hypothetical protein